MRCSPSSHQSTQVEETAEGNKGEPRWLRDFLKRTFFDACDDHPIRRNEKNRYCMSCDTAVCQYCMPSGEHRHHKVLKIYRHVYKDVVSLSAMEKYLDCTDIQPYKCNKRLVISLNPLPHCGPTSDNGVSCDICKRRLADPQLYRYCCIACKVKGFERKSDMSLPPFLSSSTSVDSNANEPPSPEKPRSQRPRARKRKRTPQRAPFF